MHEEGNAPEVFDVVRDREGNFYQITLVFDDRDGVRKVHLIRIVDMNNVVMPIDEVVLVCKNTPFLLREPREGARTKELFRRGLMSDVLGWARLLTVGYQVVHINITMEGRNGKKEKMNLDSSKKVTSTGSLARCIGTVTKQSNPHLEVTLTLETDAPPALPSETGPALPDPSEPPSALPDPSEPPSALPDPSEPPSALPDPSEAGPADHF